MKWCIIVNPKSGNGKGAKQWPKVHRALKQQKIDFFVQRSNSIDDLFQIVREALVKGITHFACVGGDGSIHWLINALMQQDICPPQKLTAAMIPLGTGNDWIRTHKIPNNIQAAVSLLKKGNRKPHDLGLIHYNNEQGQQASRYFINVAGMAYDAHVARSTEQNSKGNPIKYLLLIMKGVLDFRAVPIKVQSDTNTWIFPFFNITIGICKYNGGGTKLVPQANPRSGKFGLTMLKDIKTWEVFWNTPRMYTGSLIHHKKAVATTSSQLKIDHIDAEAPSFIEADGELLGQTPLQLTVVPNAIYTVCP